MGHYILDEVVHPTSIWSSFATAYALYNLWWKDVILIYFVVRNKSLILDHSLRLFSSVVLSIKWLISKVFYLHGMELTKREGRYNVHTNWTRYLRLHNHTQVLGSLLYIQIQQWQQLTDLRFLINSIILLCIPMIWWFWKE